MNKKVTEQDFRKPEFVDENPDDYERRLDGKIVKKDRWKKFAHSVVNDVGMNVREFELPDVASKVRELVLDSEILDWLISYNGNIMQEKLRQSILKEAAATASTAVQLRLRMVEGINWHKDYVPKE